MEKIAKATSIAIVLFAAIIAVNVGTRIDQFTLTMLGGAFLGLLIAVPTTLTAMLLLTRAQNQPRYFERGERDRATHNVTLPPSPPQYWVMPTQPPVAAQAGQPPLLANANTAVHWNLTPENLGIAPRRKFYVIGESGTMEEIHGPDDQDSGFRVINPHTLGAASI
jgi:hypothetical protein